MEQREPDGASSNAVAVSQRSREIYEAALRLFVDRGYHGTTMRDIAMALGLRAPSLYNHVASKQAILSEIMLGTQRQLIDDFQVAVAGSGDARAKVHRAVATFVAHHARHPLEALIGNREVPSLERPARDELVGMRREHEHGLRTLLEDGRRQGAFTVEYAHLTTFAILEMGVSVARWFRPEGPLSADEVAEHYANLAVRMCAGQ